MSNKSSDLNPKNAIYHSYKEKVKDIISRQANEMYRDKYFADEYKAVYLIASTLRGVANLLSSSTFTIAVYLAFSFVIPKTYAFSLALVSSILFELIKNAIWGITAKTTLKYKKISIVAVLLLLGLHLVSIGGSMFGAWQITNLLPPPATAPAPTIDIDSINQAYKVTFLEMDGQIKTLEAKKDWNSRVSLKEIINQKTALIESQKEAVKVARQANVQTMDKHTETLANNSIAAMTKRKGIRQASVIVTAFFELAFILCSIFIAYYLFRKHIDDTNEQEQGINSSVKTASVLTKTALDPTNGQEAPATNNSRTIVQGFRPMDGKRQEDDSNSSNSKELEYTRICELESCQNPFIHSIHNQKYCTTDCRKNAYLERRANK